MGVTRFLSALVLLIFFLVVEARSQPLVAQISSIESMVANHDYIFVARLTEFDPEKKSPPYGSYYETCVTIEETLKRPLYVTDPHSKLQLNLPCLESDLAKWQKHSTRLLVSLDEDIIRHNQVVPLDTENLEAMTADFTLLRTPESVIKATKKAIRDTPANLRRVHTCDFTVPAEIVKGTQWEQYWSLRVGIPVNDQLEKRVLQWIHAKDQTRRLEAVKALRYFRSNENILLARELLKDSEVTWEQDKGDDSGVKERFYGIRNLAYETLQIWGVDVEKPVISEEVPGD